METTADVVAQIQATFYNAINQIVAFLPDLIAGLVILLVGWLIAAALRAGAQKLLYAINADEWLDQAGVKDKKQKNTWINIIAQLVFWTVMILFLVPALEAWNLLEATAVLSQLFNYLPNVLAAIIIGFVGYIIARLLYQVTEKAAQTYGEGIARTLANVAQYAMLVFTALIVLNQLGIAPGLIQIFFGALMFGLALALGLSFGLGGRETASRWLDQWTKTAKKK